MQHLPKDGSVTRAEVSPLTMVTCEEMSQRIKADGGSALVVDYGEDGLTDFTLRVGEHVEGRRDRSHVDVHFCSPLKATLSTMCW